MNLCTSNNKKEIFQRRIRSDPTRVRDWDRNSSDPQLNFLLELFSLETIRIRDVGEIHVAHVRSDRRRMRVPTTLGYSLARFDPGRSQNDYNNYFIRRGSGPLCLPILKVITRCLHCPSGTALRGHASPATGTP